MDVLELLIESSEVGTYLILTEHASGFFAFLMELVNDLLQGALIQEAFRPCMTKAAFAVPIANHFEPIDAAIFVATVKWVMYVACQVAFR